MDDVRLGVQIPGDIKCFLLCIKGFLWNEVVTNYPVMTSGSSLFHCIANRVRQFVLDFLIKVNILVTSVTPLLDDGVAILIHRVVTFLIIDIVCVFPVTMTIRVALSDGGDVEPIISIPVRVFFPDFLVIVRSDFHTNDFQVKYFVRIVICNILQTWGDIHLQPVTDLGELTTYISFSLLFFLSQKMPGVVVVVNVQMVFILDILQHQVSLANLVNLDNLSLQPGDSDVELCDFLFHILIVVYFAGPWE